MQKLFGFKSIRNNFFEKRENPLGVGDLTITHCCKRQSKNLEGPRSISWSNRPLRAICCLRKVGGKKSKERGRRRQRQTRNG